jgi:hypothetical protein
VVLFAAYLAVVLGCHLEEFETAIGGEKAASTREDVVILTTKWRYWDYVRTRPGSLTWGNAA